MSEQNRIFTKSFFYNVDLRSNDSYVDMYREMVSDIVGRDRIFKKKPTGLWSKDELLLHNDPTKSDPYHNYYLTLDCKLNFKPRQKHQYIMLGFDTKYQVYSFLKDFHLDKKDVVFCFSTNEAIRDENHHKIDEAFVYKIVFKINPLYKTSIHTFAHSLIDYVNHFAKSVYGNVKVYNYIQLPSSIHDRWLDPFTFQKILDFSTIYNNYKKSEPVSLGKILSICKAKIEHYVKNSSKSVSNFISNASQVKQTTHVDEFSTTFYYKYLQDKNPYKIAKFRKDWKFAAECFIKEVIGKYIYNCKKEKNHELLDEYQRQKRDVHDCYDFDPDHLKDEIARKVCELKSKINDLEKESQDIDLKIEDLRRSWVAPQNLQPKKTDEELLATYNGDAHQLMIMMWKTSEDYIKYVRTQEQNKEDDEKLWGYRETDEYKSLVKRYKEVRNEIRLHELSIDFYTDDNYESKFKRMHKKLDELYNRLNGLVFSKREVTLFINSLKLKTKICPYKFRKIILDEFMKQGMLYTNNDNHYNRFTYICRRYLLNKDVWTRLQRELKKLRKIAISISFIEKMIIKLENHLRKNYHICINNIKYNLQFAPRVEYFGPPD